GQGGEARPRELEQRTGRGASARPSQLGQETPAAAALRARLGSDDDARRRWRRAPGRSKTAARGVQEAEDRGEGRHQHAPVGANRRRNGDGRRARRVDGGDDFTAAWTVALCFSGVAAGRRRRRREVRVRSPTATRGESCGGGAQGWPSGRPREGGYRAKRREGRPRDDGALEQSSWERPASHTRSWEAGRSLGRRAREDGPPGRRGPPVPPRGRPRLPMDVLAADRTDARPSRVRRARRRRRGPYGVQGRAPPVGSRCCRANGSN
ncbi:unnamed protein product, partial [Ixodes pacificus]